MPWPPALLLVCFLGSALSSCHGGMRPRVDASGSTVDLGGTARAEDAPSASPGRDAQIPDEAVIADSAAPDALIPDAVFGDVALVDGNLPVEVARIVREGTNFGRTTVVVYSDASAVRTKEDRLMIEHLRDGMAGPSVEVIPSGTPEVVKFLQDLALVPGVAGLGGTDIYCAGKSVSNSTRTHLTARGEISRNLECDDGATASDPVLTADCLALAR